MSEVKVNKISPRSGTTVTLGDSGDTISVPSGVTLSTASFSSTGIDDNATSTAITIDSSENVGIGETAPLTKLHVKTADSGVTPHANADDLFVENSGNAGITIGSGTTNLGSIFFGDSGSNIDGYILYNQNDRYMAFASATTEAMRIDSSGQIGIGTTSPNRQLTIAGGTNTGLQICGNGTGTGSGDGVLMFIRDDDDGFVLTQKENSYTRFDTNNTERMRLTSSGKVGIGTTSPLTELQVDASGGARFIVSRTGAGHLYMEGGDNPKVRTSVGALIFETAGENERMRINSSGFVLAGTTSSVNNAHTFKAIADSNLYAALSAEDPTTTVGSIRGIVSYASGSSGAAGTGYLYIGRTNTGDQFYVRSDGDCQNTNNSYGAISDRNLKENEVDASSQWNDIKAIQVKNYNLKSLPERTHLGVIAQDLEASGMNGLVKIDEDGTKSVKYSILYMKSVKALQEAMTRIESLEAEVTALKNQP